MRVAVLQEFYTDAYSFKCLSWPQIADTLEQRTVRILAGQLKRQDDPLIAALKGICATNKVVFEAGNPHPVCFLGGIGTLTGEISELIEVPCKRKDTMAVIPRVNGKKVQIMITGVSKCFFGLHGTQSIRSDAKIKERSAKHMKKRGTKK